MSRRTVETPRACITIAVVGTLLATLAAAPTATAAETPAPQWQGWEALQYYNEEYVNGFCLASGGGNRTVAAWLGNATGGGSYNLSYAGIVYPGSNWYNSYDPQITSTYSLRANTPDCAVAESLYNGFFVAFTASNGTAWDVYLAYGDPTYYNFYRMIENDPGNAYNPHVVTDPWGNATVVWEQYDGANYNLWSNHSTLGPYTWSGATLIEALPGNSGGATVGIDAAGNVMVTWSQYNSGASSIYANRLVPGIGWGSPVLLSNPSDGIPYSARMVVDAAGHATAVWLTNLDGNWTLRSSQYTPGGTWVAKQPLFIGRDVSTGSGRVAVDLAGQVRAVWRGGTSRDFYVNTSTLDLGGNWTPVESVARGLYSLGSIALSAGAAGEGMVVFESFTPEKRTLQSVYRQPGGRWVPLEPLESVFGPVGYIYTPQVVRTVDGSFHLAAISRTSTTHTYSLIAYRVTPDGVAPALDVTAPPGSVETGQPSVLVEGTSEPGAVVTVNGVGAAVAPDGSFGVRVALEPGPNALTVTATDGWGNQARWEGMATYSDPATLLTAQVEQLQSELTGAQQAVDDAQTALDALSADQAATQADLDDAETALTAAQAQLAAAQADLAAAQARVASLEADQAASNATLGTTTNTAVDAQNAAAGASTMALLGVLVGLAGVGVGVFAVMRATQAAEVTVRGWDPKTKEEVVGKTESPSDEGKG